jgi:hypothetical protein
MWLDGRGKECLQNLDKEISREISNKETKEMGGKHEDGSFGDIF